MSTVEKTKYAHELFEDPDLGALAKAKNSVDADFIMIQTPGSRERFLRAIAQDAERLAETARAMLSGAANEATS